MSLAPDKTPKLKLPQTGKPNQLRYPNNSITGLPVVRGRVIPLLF